MVFTNSGKQFLTYAIGSDIPNNYISYCAIGSGTLATDVTNTALAGEASRLPITGSPNFDTPRKVTFQGDFNSVQMSGIQLTEFGFLASGTFQTGSVWQRESFSAITFDGTNELQIISTIEVI